MGHVVHKCGILFKNKTKTKTQHLLSEIAVMKSVAIDTSVNHIVKGLPGECEYLNKIIVPLCWRKLCWL